MKKTAHPAIAQLRAVRRGRKIKQCDLADKIGVTHPALSYWESGVRTPNWFNFCCWVEALEVELVIKEKNDAA